MLYVTPNAFCGMLHIHKFLCFKYPVYEFRKKLHIVLLVNNVGNVSKCTAHVGNRKRLFEVVENTCFQ